jgi:hypothetical protein
MFCAAQIDRVAPWLNMHNRSADIPPSFRQHPVTLFAHRLNILNALLEFP